MATTTKTTTVRVTKETRAKLKTMAGESGESIQDVLDKAVEAYRRKRFFEEVNAAYARLRADPEAWQAYVDEFEEWDVTLMDGFEEEEWPEEG